MSSFIFFFPFSLFPPSHTSSLPLPSFLSPPSFLTSPLSLTSPYPPVSLPLSPSPLPIPFLSPFSPCLSLSTPHFLFSLLFSLFSHSFFSLLSLLRLQEKVRRHTPAKMAVSCLQRSPVLLYVRAACLCYVTYEKRERERGKKMPI